MLIYHAIGPSHGSRQNHVEKETKRRKKNQKKKEGRKKDPCVAGRRHLPVKLESALSHPLPFPLRNESRHEEIKGVVATNGLSTGVYFFSGNTNGPLANLSIMPGIDTVSMSQDFAPAAGLCPQGEIES